MKDSKNKAIQKAKGGVGKGPYPQKEREIHALRYDRNHDSGSKEHEEALAKYRKDKKYYKASGTSSAHFHSSK